MTKHYNIAGQVFGRLTALFKLDEKHKTGQTLWRCVCQCGNEVDVPVSRLVKGNKKSCGCLVVDTARLTSTKHGMRNTKLYSIWESMRKRCYDVNHDSYEHYGKSGITVFEEWNNNSSSFFKWAESNGYRDGLSLDRICNGKGYYPDNCRFINKTSQGLNKNITTIRPKDDSPLRPYSVHLGLLGTKFYFGSFSSEEDALNRRRYLVNEFISRFGSLLDEELTFDMVANFAKEFQAVFGVRLKPRRTVNVDKRQNGTESC